METTTRGQELIELDAWIAEHVMGWHIFNSGRGSVCALKNKDLVDESLKIIIPKHPFDEPSDFSPTTDPAAAMEVLEKCAEKDVFTSIAISRNGDFWEVFLGGHYHQKKGIAETLPLAICKFAQALFSK